MKENSRSPDPPLGRKPRLLFVGEGPHDIGREHDPGGALAGFLHAVLQGPGHPEPRRDWPFEVVHVRKWAALVQQPPSGEPKQRRFSQLMKVEPDARRVLASMALAAALDLDGVVVIRDCERVDNIDLGTTLRNARGEYVGTPATETPACVIATPSRSHETWLLADRDAVGQALGDEGVYHFSMSPEKRPNSDILKQHLSTQAKRLRRHEPTLRQQLAFAARPQELRRRCPRCYSAFLEDVRSELRSPP